MKLIITTYTCDMCADGEELPEEKITPITVHIGTLDPRIIYACNNCSDYFTDISEKIERPKAKVKKHTANTTWQQNVHYYLNLKASPGEQWCCAACDRCFSSVPGVKHHLTLTHRDFTQ